MPYGMMIGHALPEIEDNPQGIYQASENQEGQTSGRDRGDQRPSGNDDHPSHAHIKDNRKSLPFLVYIDTME